MNKTDALPLSGIRVLDLSRVLAGPLCTMMLGDLGAQVIKVERPFTGDDTRGWGPPFDENGRSAYFLSINRNKISISADLSSPSDVQLIRRLIGESDIVVENYRTGDLSRYGIDAGAMLRENDKLLWCSISGFGADSNRPGYDFVVQAEAGWMSITGPADGEPSKVGVALADVIAGKDAAIAILAALVGRSRIQSPTSRHLQISLYKSAVAALTNVAQNALVSGADSKRWGNAHANLVPYQLFQTGDQPIVVAVGTDRQWHNCALALGLNELAADSSLVANSGRIAARERVVREMAQRLLSQPAVQWINALQSVGVPCGRVCGVLEALQAVRGTAAFGVESSVGGAMRHPPPGLDEHGGQIRAHGWSVFDQLPILP